MARTPSRAPRGTGRLTRAATLLLLVIAAIGCAAPAAAVPTGPVSVEPPSALLSPAPEPGATAAPVETAAARTAGPPVPRVPPLQPPAYASRIEFPGMGIDLPVISGDVQPPPSYPFCDVAAYVTRFNQPYEPGITYISAHAQEDMFLPLLRASERDDGSELLGMTVDVQVSDGRSFRYEINRVVRHATDYSALDELDPSGRHLVLQTSEGVYGTIEKLQVFAELIEETTVDLERANPDPMPRDCEPEGTLAPASPI